VATNHGYMVWDTLRVNDALIGQPQMCGSWCRPTNSPGRSPCATVSNSPTASQCAVAHHTSIARWAVRNPFGQQLALQTDEMKPLDDKRFQIRLKKRFRQMTYALGSQGCFIMPERMSKTPATDQGVHRLRAVHLQAG
jgi:peptide/nickel transport system substrate-binding protein